jgi:hypothetical protein
MNRLTALLLWSIVITSLTAAAGQGGGKTTSSSTNVTSTVWDYDGSGALLLFRSDDYSGSGQATYTAINNVESFMTSTGIWFLNLYPQKTGTRQAYVTPDDPVGAEPLAPAAGYYWQNVEITSKCTDSSGNVVPLPNLVNGSNNCDFMVDFNYNRTVYKLLIGRVMNAGDPTPGKASVTCNAVNSGGHCVNWTMTAGSGTNPVVANLYSDTGGPRTPPWVFIGQYYNSARVQVTNP